MTREEAINAITAFVENYACGSDLDGLREAIEALKERPHGEWIVRRNKQGTHIYSVCSKCNVPYLETDFPNFCPNCGADMRKEGDEK